MTKDKKEKYFTRKEVAAILRITVRTVDRKIRNNDFGEILKVGNKIRILQSGVEDYIEKNKQRL